MINILCWNAQGVASPAFRRHFRNFVRINDPQVVVLVEPRINSVRADRVLTKLEFPNSYWVEAHGFNGGIWLLWWDSVSIHIDRISNQFIHICVTLIVSSEWFFFTVVYAIPKVNVRRLLWTFLENLNPGNDVALILGGDINPTLSRHDQNRSACVGSGVNNLFSDIMFNLSLVDAGFSGSHLTWNRGNLYKRLNKFLVNEAWCSRVKTFTIMQLEQLGLNHMHFLMKPTQPTISLRSRPLRYLAS
ncbi:hypothetical protein HRI_000042600 [Hibiscus trionum]|uniref:Endonuclease/exonuclease/phosphatase domain-containing protein n=1 Tax=Hibiscus trionum TaxID=183268 RepID=A0A9W7GQY5_HIBTR|nr:hypothetical protein HRI_000042600 [Hibiscus trionum]